MTEYTEATAVNIKYVKGDATQPVDDGLKIIAHCCNDIGAWGAGFVLAISRRWSYPEAEYKALTQYKLGSVNFVCCELDIIVANIIGQHGTYDQDGQPPIRYGAIESGFNTISSFAFKHNASVHMPRLGCGLAGGEWSEIEKLIHKCFKGVSVTVYDLEVR